MPAYFTTAFTDFFKKLTKNNNTVWFNENKKAYETHVKEPFYNFIEQLIEEWKKVDPSINTTAKEAIFRINRDIRFSNDKSPYKVYASAILSAGGKKDKEYPGMYIQIGADQFALYGGAYMVEKTRLQNLRTHIAYDIKAFQKVVSEKKFKQLFGTILGDKNKVLPPLFKNLLAEEPLLANKNFYYMVELPMSELYSPQLMKTLLTYFKAAKPVNDYLIEGMELNG